MNIIKKNNAQLFLVLNAVFWGSSYVWSKMLLNYLPRFSILFICSLGGLISTFVFFYPSLKTIKKSSIIPSAAVSSFSIISNTFFMLALQYTSSSNTAFIVQTSVIITPVLMGLLERKMPQRRILISAFIALAGLFILTCDFNNFHLKPGDLLAFGNALFFSVFLVGLEKNSKKVDAVHFTFIHHATNTIGFLIAALLLERHLVSLHNLKNPAFVVLAAASTLVAVITVLIQSKAIKFVRPEKATLIYSLEPVTTLILGLVLIGEKMNGIKPIIGCLLIFASVLFSIHRPAGRKKGYGLRPSTKPAVNN